MQLTQKESSLLKDLKTQEALCAEKYTKHAALAHDPQLKNLFSDLAQVERAHLKMIQDMTEGQVPDISGGGTAMPSTFTMAYTGETTEKKEDAYLCQDVLSMEKHASHLYDTCIFEFTTDNARNLLNHIQKQEQEHGKKIYDYMTANSMYA